MEDLPQDTIQFQAIVPSIQSAIRVAGDGGARLVLDISESEMGNFLPIMLMREELLIVRIQTTPRQVLD